MVNNSLSIVFRYPRNENQEVVSGEVKNAFHFTNSLISKSAHSSIISFEEDLDENYVENRADGVMILRISTPKSRGVIRYLTRVCNGYFFCRKKVLKKYDIVHSHVTYGSLLAVLLGFRKVLVTTPHGTNYQEIQTELTNSAKDRLRKINAELQRILDSFAMNASALNISVSEYQVPDMQHHYKCVRPISVVYNGVPDYYKKDKQIKVYDALFIGRACKKKGLDLFYQLTQHFPNQKFKMVLGDNIFTTLSDSFMSKLDQAENIDVAYKRSEQELVTDINSSKVLLVPSRGYESLPTVIMEAIACNVPVVATNAWGNPEVIKNPHMLFQEDSFESFVNAYQYSLKRGYQIDDYCCKKLNIEHSRLLQAYKDIQDD